MQIVGKCNLTQMRKRLLHRKDDEQTGRFAERIRRRHSPASTDRDLLLRQVRASEKSLWITAALTAALVALTFCQWKANESIAQLEEARSRPVFSVTQSRYKELEGFLPNSFRVTAVAGVQTITESIASEIFLIRFYPNDAGDVGLCRASSKHFFIYDNDTLSYSLSNEAIGLIVAGKKYSDPSKYGFSIQPISTAIRIHFVDIFGFGREQNLLLQGGTAVQLDPINFKADTWTDLDLSLDFSNDEDLLLFRINDGTISQNCAEALRTLTNITHIKVAYNYVMYSGDQNIRYRDTDIFEPADDRITTLNPQPRYLEFDESKPVYRIVTRPGRRPSLALP